MTIIDADIYRDGGSLSVTIVSESACKTVFLRIRKERCGDSNHEYRIRGYDRLFLYPSASAVGDYSEIAKGSTEEKELVMLLTRLCDSRKFSVAEGAYRNQTKVEIRARELLAAIPDRQIA